jgi:F-type H+-transporting ATPase subunit alpha
VPVEEQVAIIHVSTKGMLDKVPEKRVREFESEFLGLLRAQYRDTLDQLGKGKYDDNLTATLNQVATDLAKKYAN